MATLAVKAQAYAEKIKVLSDQIVQAQKPIQILNAIKWSPDVDQFLLQNKFKEMPKWGPENYQRMPTGFNPTDKIREFQEIVDGIHRQLGKTDRVAVLLAEICRQYQVVCRMLESRGTKEFGDFSRELYGSTRDKFFDDRCTVRELGTTLKEILDGFDHRVLGPQYPKILEAPIVVMALNKRFSEYFHEHVIISELSDSLIADAAAGSDRVRIRSDARFSSRDIDILEVHEGWVHVGTTLNGMRQSYATWLSKGPPRVAATQEGLATMMEVFTFRTYPIRARRINDRIMGVSLVEDGANVLELAQYYREQGYSDEDTLYNIRRIFRGASLEGGHPFTKDISYAKGFVENYNFIRTAIGTGRPQLVPFLFVGKLHLVDVPLLYELSLEGIIDPPHYLPEHFRDLNGLAIWMSYSNFFNKINLTQIRTYYEKLFSTIPVACKL